MDPSVDPFGTPLVTGTTSKACPLLGVVSVVSLVRFARDTAFKVISMYVWDRENRSQR